MRYQDRQHRYELDEREDETLAERARGQPGKRPRTLADGRRSSAAPGSLSPGKRTVTMDLGRRAMSQAAIQLKSHGASAHAEALEALDLDLERAGGGQPLPEAVRRKMERVLAADFSAVRIHEGPQARALGALAYTRGADIYFAPGQYDPESRRGQELLGHELAHVVQQSQGRVQPTTQSGGVAINESSSLEREADELGAKAAAAPARGRAAPGAAPAAVRRDALGPGTAAPIQRQPDPAAAALDAVKSKEIEGAEARERTSWPGVVARQQHRKKDIEYHLKTKLAADTRAVLERLLHRWDGTVVVQAGFDPVAGAVDDKSLRQRIAADRADVAVLKEKKFASVVEWVHKLTTALEAFLDLRQSIQEEEIEFDRFDDELLDPDVKKALATVPGEFRPADLKALLAQETGDFTDTNIAGLEGKTKGIVNKLSPNPGFVGVGQINNDANKDARARAKQLGISLPEKIADKDPRKDPATGIKLAANYLAYIGKQLNDGLPADPPRPTGAAMRKLVFAAYNGGPFALIKAVKHVAKEGKYTWESIAADEQAMASFQKPGEVRDYVKRVTERVP